MAKRKYRPLAFVGKRTVGAYHWRRAVGTAQWVEENVYLTPEASPAMPGPLQLKFSPHLRMMFNFLDRRHVWKVVGRFSTQCGKTLYMQCRMAYVLDTRPTKLQWAIPNKDEVSDYIIQKIEPFIAGVKVLKVKVEDYRQTEKVRAKRTRIPVSGGDCVFTGTTKSDKRSKTVKEIYMDEAALFDAGAVVELEGRTKSVARYGRKVVVVSSRLFEGDEIDKAHQDCDVFYEWQLPCPACGRPWLPGSEHLKWPTLKEYAKEQGSPEDEVNFKSYKDYALRDVRVECPSCGHKVRTEDRDRLLLEIKDDTGWWVHTGGPLDGGAVGVMGNALGMYFTTFESIAALIIDAEDHGTYEDMKQIYLDYFDEIYKPKEELTRKDDILLLTLGRPAELVPVDTYKLYLTIDTQKNGYWWGVWAFEYGFRMHTVLHGYATTEQELEMLMGRRWEVEGGGVKIVDKTLIDRKGIKERTAEVDAWVQGLIVHEGMEGRIYPTMGVENDAAGRYVIETKVEKDVTTDERLPTPITALRLNNYMLKTELQALIDRSIQKINGEVEDTRRLFFVNQGIVDAAKNRERSVSTDFERQMTAERYGKAVNPTTGKVAAKESWHNPRQADNHIWDCAFAAVGAAMHDNVMLAQKPGKVDLGKMMDEMGI